jgi:hypothetical protein
MAFTRSDFPEKGKMSLITCNPDGTDERILVTQPRTSFDALPAWRPRGGEILLAVIGPGQGKTSLQVRNFSTSQETRQLRLEDLPIYRLLWMPDDQGLLIVYDRLLGFLGQNQVGFLSYPEGRFYPVTNDTNSYTTLSVSGDGKTIATVQRRATQTLYWLPAAGSVADSPPMAAAQSKDAAFFDWSENENDLYFGAGGDLVRISLDGSNRQTLISDPSAQVMRPSRCYGGRYVVFAWANHGASKSNQIWRVDADGSNPRQLTFGALDVSEACSADGQWVYYEDAAQFRMLRVPVEGGTPEEVPGTHGLANLPGLGLSPDGKMMVFFETLKDPARAPGRLVLVPLNGGADAKPRFLRPDPRFSVFPRFSPDNRSLVYIIHEGGADNVWIQPIDGSPGHPLTHFQSDAIKYFAFSPDGKTLGVMREHAESDVVLLQDKGSSSKESISRRQ